MNKLESSDDFENCFGPKNRGVPSEKRNWNYKRVLSIKNVEIRTNANFEKFEVSPNKNESNEKAPTLFGG